MYLGRPVEIGLTIGNYEDDISKSAYFRPTMENTRTLNKQMQAKYGENNTLYCKTHYKEKFAESGA